jgi:hypothetical protein
MEEVNADNPPEYEAGTLLWRLKYAYDNPPREFLLIEAGMKIEAVEADRDRWRSIAERAMENLETAVKLLETLNGALND